MSAETMRPPMLIDLAFSSWSEKARWALEWKGVEYKRREFVPMIDDGWLRRTAGTDEVPALVRDGKPPLAGSTRIALALEAEAPEPRLLPADRVARAEALRWQDWASDTLMPVGRSLVTAGLASVPGAALATVPPTAPGYARAFAAIAVPIGLRAFRRSYGLDAAALAQGREDAPRLLEQASAAIEAGGPSSYLVGGAFSLADMALASALVLFAPPPNEWLPRPMPDPLREAFTSKDLVARFPALFAWRDEMVRRHRRPRAPG